jgi:hypothetical protein
VSNTFFYTFRTNRFVDQIEEVLGQEVFVIEKPSKDFARLQSEIKKSGANHVVGLAIIEKGKSRFELETYNRIGVGRAVKSSDLEKVSLNVRSGLEKTGIPSSKGMSYGFCNYVAFRLAASLPKLERSFIHLKKEDICKLSKL